MRGMTTEIGLGRRIAWYRQRRGLSQEVLADMVGRTADWLSKVENGRIQLDRYSVMSNLAGALDVSLGDLLGEPSLMKWTADSGRSTVPALRSVLMDYRQLTRLAADKPLGEVQPLDALDAEVTAIWNAYQDSRFGYVTHRLVALVPELRVAAHEYERDERLRADGLCALTYQVAALTLTKLGEADLAWTASDRGIEAAYRCGDPVLIGSLFRSVTHSLQSIGAYSEAVQMTNDAATFFDPHLSSASPTMLSVYGALLLAGAMAAARADDRATVRHFLGEAEQTALRMGHDANHLWTAFGPTNVAIHRVSTAMELGDVQIAVDLGPRVDTTTLPTERRVRHSLEVARGLSTSNRREDALDLLLAAEQLAPEQVRYHFLSRNLVQTWIKTQRGKPSWQLADLAHRLGAA
jgi:transcriptional regulator with XRE-family HTH domain